MCATVKWFSDFYLSGDLNSNCNNSIHQKDVCSKRSSTARDNFDIVKVTTVVMVVPDDAI